MGLTISNLQRVSEGNKWKILGKLAFTGTYTTNGESLAPNSLGLNTIDNIFLQSEQGYSFEFDYANNKVKVFAGGSGTTGATSGGTPAGTNSTSAVTGTAEAQTFTGTASVLNLATPVFSGTGLTAAGQVMTTTDNQTMTLNQCAGMWLLPATATTPPMLIVSNTAVSGAPAVLTVIGAAATDAGAYKIVATIPVGTNGASASLTATAAAQTFTGSALSTHTHSVSEVAGGEVDNGTSLTALSAVEFEAIGV